MNNDKDNKRNEQTTFWGKDFISIILIPIISGVIGIILNKFGEICPWCYLVVGLVISLISILLFYLIGLVFMIPRINKHIEKKSQELCEKVIDKKCLLFLI